MKTNYFKFLATTLCAGALFFATTGNAQWTALGPNTTDAPVVSLQSFNGNLYVGGMFFHPYADLAVWNGSSYSAPLVSAGNEVYSMASFDSVIYFSIGDFIYQQVNSSVSKIATLNSQASAIYFWNHKLYAGGNFTQLNGKKYGYIASYDGTKWDSLMSGGANGMTSDVYAFCSYNNQLVVGGYFWTGGTTLLDNIGLWDGAGNWTKLGNGMYDPAGGYSVNALVSYNGILYAGGDIDSASGVKISGLAQWNGTKWDSVGNRHSTSSTVYALTVFNGGVVAGGYFDSIMSWNGVAWSVLGKIPSASEVEALAVYNGNLYAAGQFSMVNGVSTNYVAEYTIPTSVNEISTSNSISVYPNPNNGTFNLEITNYKSGMTNTVEVYNILGEKVYSQLAIDNSQLTINLKQPAGIYLYRVLSAEGKTMGTGKVIVK
ncbi:MAG TPA: T9SS type A sorting domain-containing protein [Bacteroidia bacterium]|jgi:hypothetical protein|nr:T9SS type A sorting domain-containing protein [Bacteroidia bacterium]